MKASGELGAAHSNAPRWHTRGTFWKQIRSLPAGSTAGAKTGEAHRVGARMATRGGGSTTHSSDEIESWTVYQVAMWLYGLASEPMPAKLKQLSEKHVLALAYKRGQTLCPESCRLGDGQTEIWRLQLKEAARMVISRQAHPLSAPHPDPPLPTLHPSSAASQKGLRCHTGRSTES